MVMVPKYGSDFFEVEDSVMTGALEIESGEVSVDQTGFHVEMIS